MDALWNLEDKWKISTEKALVMLVCTSIFVILLCATTIFIILKKKAQRNTRIASHDSDDETESLIMYQGRSSSTCGLYIKNAITGSGCWSVAHKWSNDDCILNFKDLSIWGERSITPTCLQSSGCLGAKKLPVWQRPILMGEKCELPRFSGLILYDERGRPLPHHHQHTEQQTASLASYNYHQGEAEVVSRQTMIMHLL